MAHYENEDFTWDPTVDLWLPGSPVQSRFTCAVVARNSDEQAA